MPADDQPHWQPISELPLIGEMIRGNSGEPNWILPIAVLVAGGGYAASAAILARELRSESGRLGAGDGATSTPKVATQPIAGSDDALPVDTSPAGAPPTGTPVVDTPPSSALAEAPTVDVPDAEPSAGDRTGAPDWSPPGLSKST